MGHVKPSIKQSKPTKANFSLAVLQAEGMCLDNTGTVQHYVGLYKQSIVTIDQDAGVPLMWSLNGKGGHHSWLVTPTIVEIGGLSNE